MRCTVGTGVGVFNFVDYVCFTYIFFANNDDYKMQSEGLRQNILLKSY